MNTLTWDILGSWFRHKSANTKSCFSDSQLLIGLLIRKKPSVFVVLEQRAWNVLGIDHDTIKSGCSGRPLYLRGKNQKTSTSVIFGSTALRYHEHYPYWVNQIWDGHFCSIYTLSAIINPVTKGCLSSLYAMSLWQYARSDLWCHIYVAQLRM